MTSWASPASDMIKFLKSFAYAGRGFIHCLGERNFRFHMCAAAFVIFVAAGFYELTRAEWAVLLLTIGAVPAFEAVNTALERLCDRVDKEQNEFIRRCKDCAAAAVFIAAIASVAVGIALFGDAERLSAMLRYFFCDPVHAILLLLAIAGAVMVVLIPERFKK